MSEMMPATAPAPSLTDMSTLSSKSATNRPKRRKFDQIENDGINVKVFNKLRAMSG